MDLTVSNLAQSLAGTAGAERVVAKERKAQEKPTVSNRRQNDLVVVDVETAEAIRDPKGNTDEEAHQERQQRSAYKPGEGGKPPEPPHIDIEG
jgi:hypothetical protein